MPHLMHEGLEVRVGLAAWSGLGKSIGRWSRGPRKHWESCLTARESKRKVDRLENVGAHVISIRDLLLLFNLQTMISSVVFWPAHLSHEASPRCSDPHVRDCPVSMRYYHLLLTMLQDVMTRGGIQRVGRVTMKRRRSDTGRRQPFAAQQPEATRMMNDAGAISKGPSLPSEGMGVMCSSRAIRGALLQRHVADGWYASAFRQQANSPSSPSTPA